MAKTSDSIHLARLKRALLALDKMQAKLDAVERRESEPIAIIGLGCRFPGAPNPLAFWELLRDGVDGITEVPKARWDIDAYYDPDPDAPGKMYTRYGGFIGQVDQFDAHFFGLSPREVVSLDPQQRLLLEVSWEALENAGLAPFELPKRSGIFVGIGAHDYAQLLRQRGEAEIDAYLSTGTDSSVASGRLSYFYGLQGPSFSVDTACSSSLAAVHLAVMSLRRLESDLALCGGVDLMLTPDVTINFSKARMLAPDGRCKTFSAKANGYVRGEGCGIIVLKRLSDAQADGDNILALIRGSAINQDGRTSGLTVPNGPSQQAVIRDALENARLSPAQVSYVEAHGTGTSLGDPIEVGALGSVFGERDRKHPLIIGSVKTNIGHLEAAAGIASLIKVVLSLQHQEIPPHLHFNEPSPHIEWESLPIRVVTERIGWPNAEQPPIAGVSSFGFSGTNAHVLLQAAKDNQTARFDSAQSLRPYHLLTLSAKTEEALATLVAHYQSYLGKERALDRVAWSDICFTANMGRTHFEHRLSLLAQNVPEAVDALSAYLNGHDEGTGVLTGEATGRVKIAFLFTGQGSQYVDMGRQLYETEPIFRQTLERCAEILRPLNVPLLSILYPAQIEHGLVEKKGFAEPSAIDQTAYTQPALFALEYALAQLWRSWGIEPSVVMGHSVGEVVAACVAGVFSLEDGLKLVAERGRLMQRTQKGEMVAVFAEEERLKSLLRGSYSRRVSIAAINGPESVVISGESASVQRVVAQLERLGIRTKKLNVSHAFHSPLMEPILRRFERVASQIDYSSPQIAIISNVTGRLVTREMSTPTYWSRHIREAVRFADGIQTLEQQGLDVFIEIGPKPTLLSMGRRLLPDVGKWLPSLRQGHDDWGQLSNLLNGLGQLYVLGCEVDWAGFHASTQPRQKVVLPTYPFQRERYWVEQRGLAVKGVSPLLDKMTKSPLHKATIFETAFSVQNFPFLKDHQVYDAVVSPAACHLAMLLEAAEAVFDTPSCTLSDVIFPQALVMPEDASAACTVQVVVTKTAGDEDEKAFQLISFAADDDAEQVLTHATGEVAPLTLRAEVFSLDELRESCPTEIASGRIYEAAAKQQIIFGPTFRWLSRVWVGDGEALVKLERPEALRSLGGHPLHPGLLDACFQAVDATQHNKDHDTYAKRAESETALPFMVAELTFYQAAQGEAWWCYVQQVDQNRWDIWLISDDGQVLAEILGFEMRAAPRSALSSTRTGEQAWHDWLYQVTWQAQPLAPVSPPAAEESWLIFADANGVGREVARELHESGQACLLVLEGEGYQYAPSDSLDEPPVATIDPREPQHYHLLLEEMQKASVPTLSGVIYARRLTGHQGLSRQGDESDVSANVENLYSGLLHLVQSLVQADLMPRLWLVTENAQAVSSRELVNPVQASLWGLALTVAAEHPPLSCTRIDLDNWHDEASLLAELRGAGKEDRVAIRDCERFVARLAPWQGDDEPKEAVQVRLSAYGTPDNLELQPLTRRVPAPHEVEIEVFAAGLNFRDVLNVLGMLADFYAETLNIHQASEIPLGFECAGIISAVGEEVSDFEVGDRVMALAIGGLASFVTVDAEQVVGLPNGLSFEEGATIPLAFLTAYQALNRLANLQAGERVLIHAASGGVGQAAVQVAQLVGAEIFGTASQKKWDVLSSIGVAVVMNSRTLDFAEQVMELTEGQGVDVVLNSLSGEFIDKSLACLGQNGRFVEIGKLGILTPQQVQAQRPDVAYYPFEVGQPLESTPRAVGAMLNELASLFAAGDLKPLPITRFALKEIDQAVRFMQQAKHIGKIVISFKTKHIDIPPESSVLITGGLGGLGLQIAQQLVADGATHLVLAGRREPSQRAQAVIEKLEGVGAEVTVAQADVAKEQEVARLLATLAWRSTCQTKAPLRGIIHAAGVLDDGVLMRQNRARFEKVMAPKGAGAWHLHTQSLNQKISLDFFVCFSSVASLIGSPGQANYAAANAFMDGLMQHRRALGLPALSINWGAWADVGMAADLAAQSKAQGIGMIAPAKGAELFAHLLKGSEAQLVVFPVDWERFLKQQTIQNLRFFENLQPKAYLGPESLKEKIKPKAAPPKLIEQLEAAPHLRERKQLLTTYIRSTIGSILQTPPQRIKDRSRLFDLGLDSLMEVELRTRLEVQLERKLRPTLIFHYPTIETLVDHLAEELFPEIDETISPPSGPTAEEETVEASMASAGPSLPPKLPSVAAQALEEMAKRLAQQLGMG